MLKSALNKELVLTLANSQRINFEAYGQNMKIPMAVLNIHNPSHKHYRDRHFSYFTKLTSVLSSNLNGNLMNPILHRALNHFLKPFRVNTSDLNEKINRMNSIDCFSRPFEDQTILVIREELKNLFKSKNVTVLYASETINTFDIYFDDITECNNIEFCPIDFNFSDSFFTLKNPDSTKITVIINPNKIKNLYMFKNMNDNETIEKLSFDFAISTLAALISDQYREIKTNQILTSFNIIAELGRRNISNSLLSGKSKDIDKVTGMAYKLYKNTLNDFAMMNNSKNEYSTYPKWSDLISGLEMYDNSFATNPIYLYQALAELSDTEIAHNIKRKFMGIDFKGRGRFSTLTKKDPKASDATNIYRATLATSRILPYIYFSTYFFSSGLTFPVTTRINNAINNASFSSSSITGTNINFDSLKLINNRISTLIKDYFKILNNPIYCNRNVVKVLSYLFNYDSDMLERLVKREVEADE